MFYACGFLGKFALKTTSYNECTCSFTLRITAGTILYFSLRVKKVVKSNQEGSKHADLRQKVEFIHDASIINANDNDLTRVPEILHLQAIIPVPG